MIFINAHYKNYGSYNVLGGSSDPSPSIRSHGCVFTVSHEWAMSYVVLHDPHFCVIQCCEFLFLRG